MSEAPTLLEQTAAVERAAVNYRGHINTLVGLVARGKRLQHELDMLLMWVPALEASAVTMRRLAVTDADEPSRAGARTREDAA